MPFGCAYRFVIYCKLSASLHRGLWTAVAVVSGFCAPVSGAISVSTVDQVYMEDFDSLRSSGNGSWDNDDTLTGWYSTWVSISAYPFGVGYPLVSYGSSSDDRALGMSLGSTSYVTFGVALVNNTGSTIQSVSVSFYGEQWYSNTNSGADPGGLAFRYRTGGSAGVGGIFTDVAALNYDPASGVISESGGNYGLNGQGYYLTNGNHSDYRTLITHTFAIDGGWETGENLMLIWDASYAYPADRAPDGLAIDDLEVTFSTSAVPEPAAYGLYVAMVMAGMIGWRRRRRVVTR
jgi:hypothetical protein